MARYPNINAEFNTTIALLRDTYVKDMIALRHRPTVWGFKRYESTGHFILEVECASCLAIGGIDLNELRPIKGVDVEYSRILVLDLPCPNYGRLSHELLFGVV